MLWIEPFKECFKCGADSPCASAAIEKIKNRQENKRRLDLEQVKNKREILINKNVRFYFYSLSFLIFVICLSIYKVSCLFMLSAFDYSGSMMTFLLYLIAYTLGWGMLCFWFGKVFILEMHHSMFKRMAEVCRTVSEGKDAALEFRESGFASYADEFNKMVNTLKNQHPDPKEQKK